MKEIHANIYLALVGLVVAAAGFVLFVSASSDDGGAAESTQERVCLSAEVWSADDGERPCAQIVKVWEDGSTRVRITQADGDVLWITSTGSRW